MLIHSIRKILFIFCVGFLILSLFLYLVGGRISDRVAASTPPAIPTSEALPNWVQITFSSIPTVLESGSINLGQLVADAGIDINNIIEELGYDPSRSWDAGEQISQIMMLGDIEEAAHLSTWTIARSAILGNTPLDTIQLGDVAPLQWQTIADLVRALPNLKDISLRDLPPIYDLIKGKIGSIDPSRSLGDLVSGNPQIADLILGKGNINLDNYPLSSIPGIENLPLKNLARWQESLLGGIPGLEFVPLAKLFAGFAQGGFVALLDLPWSDKEARRFNTITGSYQEGFHVKCDRPSCAYVELSGPSGLGATAVHGKQWISGKSQKVRGGSGCLKGWEPTGRHPFGSAFKVVLTKTIESEGRADFSLYFRFSLPCGKSPYILGPFPWLSHHEKDLIFVGLLDPEPLPETPPTTGSTPPPEDLPPSVNPGDISAGQDRCENYRGVNVAALKAAITTIESQGSGYQAIGEYVCDNQGNCGRGLGKYQFMSDRNDVNAVISQKPGGQEFLEQINNSNANKVELAQELTRYFSAESQEALADRWLERLIDNASNKGLTGDDVVSDAGEQHNAGEGGRSPEYGKRTVEIYKKVKPQITANCQKEKGGCTGTFVHPAPGYPKTDVFGACRPVGSCRRRHEGVDVGTPTGTPIRAADGGTVTFAGSKGCYGLTIDLQHCQTGRITRYAHLSQVLVSPGQQVSQGQIVAKSGNTGCGTGPHLHFEIHSAGAAEDPENYLKF
ncbi:hypothetical protein C7B80_30200 [Cyanosarcina cf. burmensis CCALA 770]|nr:hypothetical protein C7B80_30200 [Cyanosarcina cf. burmensis CCALA 770]